MKRKLFNVFLVMLLIPAMLFVNGCDKDDDIEGEMKLVEDYNEVNEILSELNQNKDDLKQIKVEGEKTETIISEDEEPKKVMYINGSFDYINNKFAVKKYNETGYALEYVVKEGEDYISYISYSDGDNDSYVVNKSYVANTMIYFEQAGVDINRLNLSSYENFKSSYISLMKENIGIQLNADDNYNFNLSPTTNVYKNNKMYMFEYVLETAVFEDAGVENLIVKASITFNNDSICGVKYVYDMTTPSGRGVTELVLNYSEGVDTSLYLNDLSGFTGEHRRDDISIIPIIDGYRDTENDIFYEYDAGVEISYPEFENLGIEGWYLDPEYKISVDTLDEVPCYDMFIYAKTNVSDDYGLVMVEVYGDGNYGGSLTEYRAWIAVEANSEFEFVYDTYLYYDCIVINGNYITYSAMQLNGEEFADNSFLVESQKTYYLKISGEVRWWD